MARLQIQALFDANWSAEHRTYLCTQRYSRVHKGSSVVQLQLENETVVFLPDDIPAATPSFLELRVPNYSIPEDTLQTQVVFAWMNIRSSLRPNEGTAFDILSSPQSVKWPSQALNNLNVELDHLITRKRGVGDHANDDNLLQKGRPLIMR